MKNKSRHQKIKIYYNQLDNVVNNVKFRKFLKSQKPYIDTGKLCEYYCTILLGLEVYQNFIKPGDIIDNDNKLYEVKFRRINKIKNGNLVNVPAGMVIKHLRRIDSVLYVFLNEENDLPIKIYRFSSEHIEFTNKSETRVTFRNALRKGLYDEIYSE